MQRNNISDSGQRLTYKFQRMNVELSKLEENFMRYQFRKAALVLFLARKLCSEYKQARIRCLIRLAIVIDGGN